MEEHQLLQAATDGTIVGPTHSHLAPVILRAQDVTVNNGDFVLAGGNVTIHKHYHSYPALIAGANANTVISVLQLVRNLRTTHLDILSKATPGTGVWFFKTKEFILWLDLKGNLKILWGTGIPGAGKTVMTSIIINELENRAAAANGSICVAYVYFRYSDAADLTFRNVLEVLVKQTVERHPNCALLAEQAYARHLHERTQPTEAELLQLLHRFTETVAATFYFLDALDEAPVRLQVDIVKKLASLNVRLFITSRPLKAVEARVPEAHSFSLVAREDDLDLHIAHEISCSRELHDLLEGSDPSFRDEIVSSIKKNCGGMFLHASLQLNALCDCASAQEVTEVLETFPSNIEDVYLHTWDRIIKQRPNHAFTAKAVILWVLYASRPMIIDEVERAVATHPDTHKFEAGRMMSRATLTSLCCGLVTIEEESRLVRLVHYTAKDTLQQLLHESFPHPHSLLATVCMTHLFVCGFQNTTIDSEQEFTSALQADRLLNYASEAWASHAHKCLDVIEIRDKITNFISNSSAFPAFLRGGGYFDILAPLHVVARHNLPLNLLPEDAIGDPNVVTKFLKASPLIIASGWGNHDLVEALLHLPNIQVNLTDNDGWSPLTWAASEGKDEIITLLVAHKEVQVNLVDDAGWSALMFAANEGHSGSVRLLIAHANIEVNLADDDGWSALMLAASKGYKEFVAHLAHPKREVVGFHETDAWAELVSATSEDYECIVQLLLQHPDIKVNLVDGEGRAAVMFAACEGYEDLVRLILSHPDIEVNLVDHEGCSAIMYAASKGREGTVELFLAHPDIDVNLVDEDGWPVLMHAVSHGHAVVVSLLLARPDIQINLVDHDRGWSALMKAAREGFEDIVKLLFAHPDIQVNIVDDEGWSALMEAAYRGFEGVMRMLLVFPGIQVNILGKDDFSALMLAAWHGREGVVSLLLPHPEMDVNLANERGETALKMAAQRGHAGVVRKFLSVPHLDVDAKSSEDGRTALEAALAEGHGDIVFLLREYGSPASDDSVWERLSLKLGSDLGDEVSDDYSSSDSSEMYYDAEEWVEEAFDTVRFHEC